MLDYNQSRWKASVYTWKGPMSRAFLMREILHK